MTNFHYKFRRKEILEELKMSEDLSDERKIDLMEEYFQLEQDEKQIIKEEVRECLVEANDCLNLVNGLEIITHTLTKKFPILQQKILQVREKLIQAGLHNKQSI